MSRCANSAEGGSSSVIVKNLARTEDTVIMHSGWQNSRLRMVLFFRVQDYGVKGMNNPTLPH
jgi:hypothetical protein